MVADAYSNMGKFPWSGWDPITSDHVINYVIVLMIL